MSGPRAALVAALGLCLALGGSLLGSSRGQGKGATTGQRFEWILGNRKVEVEMRPAPAPTPDASPSFEYRLLDWPEQDSGWQDAATFQALLDRTTRRLDRRHLVLKWVNASSWQSFLWVLVGLAGQLCFFGRMFYQWWVSEQQGASVVPTAFWWLSLLGGIALLSYFVWRQDPIGILGQSTGALVYARNLWLIHVGRAAPVTIGEAES